MRTESSSTTPPQGRSIRGPNAAQAGDRVQVEVDSGSSVAVTYPGHSPVQVAVRNGRAQIDVPTSVPSGTLVHVVVLGRVPPEGISIAIVEPRPAGGSTGGSGSGGGT